MQVADRAHLDWEQRDFHVTPVECRDDSDGVGVTFTGVASVVDTPYEVHDIFGTFNETIRSGAFKRTLSNRDDVRLLINHEGVPIARTKSGTLELSADPHLRATAKLDAANPTVQEIRSAMARGDIDQMSIGMRVVDQEWNKDYTERTIGEIKLFDVSAVTFPASETTTASLRSQKLRTIEPLFKALRAGRTLSAANIALLTNVLAELATADTALEPLRSVIDETDEALDAAQQALASVLGVANPDTDDAAAAAEDADESARQALYERQHRLRELHLAFAA